MHQKIYMNLKETIMKKTFKKLILILAAIAIVVTAMPESVSAYSKRNPFRHGTYSGGITVVSISPIQGDYTSDFVTKEISGKKRKVTDEVINIQTSTWYEGADHAVQETYFSYLYRVNSKRAVGMDEYGTRIDVKRVSNKKIKVRIGGKGNSWITCKYESSNPFLY